MATETAAGDVVVVLSDDSPIYGDTAEYPATFRFTVSAPAIGDAEIEADAPYSVVKREDDRLTIRTQTDKDTALFFRFRQKRFVTNVAMRDGVDLFTFGVLPKDGKPRPAFVNRNPYLCRNTYLVGDPVLGRAVSSATNDDVLPYVPVVQHCRGSGRSGGVRVPYEHEREDGLDFLAWLRRQSWCDGRVFVRGSSYPASVHWTYLSVAPECVKGADLEVQDQNRYNICYRNGFFKAGLHGNWFVGEYRKGDPHRRVDKSVNYQQFPLGDFPRRCFGEDVPALSNVLRHPDPDDPFWTSGEAGSGAECRGALANSKVPVLMVGRFYDLYTDGMFQMWRELPPERRARCAFIVGANNHGDTIDDELRGTLADCPAGTVEVTFANRVDEWFGYVMDGREPTTFKRGMTTYYALWEDKWHTEEELLDGPRKVELPLGKGESSYVYDPKRTPIDFPGSGGICFGGMRIQPKPDFRDDMKSFVLPPLKERLDVRGRMTARLAVRSDCEDTCFYVRLSVKKSDGKWYLLRDDITSLCFKRPCYVPGEVRLLDFRFADHAFRLERGDVLRVDVASSCLHFAPHANVKGDQFAVKEPKVARNTVVADLSSVTLPCIWN